MPPSQTPVSCRPSSSPSLLTSFAHQTIFRRGAHPCHRHRARRTSHHSDAPRMSMPHLFNWQSVRLREGEVTFVMRWHGHDCTCAVRANHIVSDPQRERLPTQRVRDHRSRRDAGLRLRHRAVKV
eukprot:scaffold159670_cov32-Tisochrysis_lutea.AAC.2